jgi:hypothetical protein
MKSNGDGNVVIVGQPGRMIRSLWITFRTTADDKDDDTEVLVTVKPESGQIVARYRQARAKVYETGFLHTEQLQLAGPVSEHEVVGANLTIEISPNGSDTWMFDWELVGSWSDGVPFSVGQTGVALDENNRRLETVIKI